MGTRSVIGVMHGTNCKAVYCHWDGYLSHNGRILQDYYDSSKANHLVALGDLSSLRPNIGEQHPFSKYEINEKSPNIDALIALYEEAESKGWCTFYGRDRGESNADFKTLTDWEKFVEYFHGCGAEYGYINDNGVWYVCSSNDMTLKVLSEELAKEEVEA